LEQGAQRFDKNNLPQIHEMEYEWIVLEQFCNSIKFGLAPILALRLAGVDGVANRKA
jgi:hypothetical protein